jgi:hypothetical protein
VRKPKMCFAGHIPIGCTISMLRRALLSNFQAYVGAHGLSSIWLISFSEALPPNPILHFTMKISPQFMTRAQSGRKGNLLLSYPILKRKPPDTTPTTVMLAIQFNLTSKRSKAEEGGFGDGQMRHEKRSTE